MNPEIHPWLRRTAALIVAAVAAYASYQHQRTFALAGGADPTSAALWPLSVDGLLLLATAGLLTPASLPSRRRIASWLAFGLGIAVSLAANIAAAPVLNWHAVLVAGWPPVALLLAVELITHTPRHPALAAPRPETESETALSPEVSTPRAAADIMWDHFQHEAAQGRTPTGAELDRIAGTNNFGRAVLRRWRRTGRIPRPAPDQAPVP